MVCRAVADTLIDGYTRAGRLLYHFHYSKVDSMKAFLRKTVRSVAHWPFIGRLVRIGVAVIRLPEFRDQQHAERKTWRAVSHPTHFAETDERNFWDQFGSTQLPTLLKTISDLNHRQIAAENDHDNLRKSAPVALRKLTREVSELRQQMGHFSFKLDSAAAERLNDLAETKQLVARLEADQLQLRAVLEADQLQLRAVLDADQLQLRAVAQRSDSMQDSFNGLQQLLDSVQQAVNDVRSQVEQMATGTAHARDKANSVGDSIAFAVQRIEFVRRELMFELRYGAGAKKDDKALTVTSEILSHEKVEAARRDALRLNLGCGHIALDGYINVDRRALPGVDIVAEVDSLPLEAGEVTEIFSSHLLEHFPEEQLRRELLPYYNSLLKAGGVFRAVVPDAQAMIAHYAQGDYPYEDMREVLYGSQDYDGDFHFNMFTPESLSALLVEAGFGTPQVIESGRKNGRCYEFEIVAEKHTAAAAAN